MTTSKRTIQAVTHECSSTASFDAMRSEIEPRTATNSYTDSKGEFSLVSGGNDDVNRFLRMNAYTAAMAFINGEFTVEGDLFLATRFFLHRRPSNFSDYWLSLRAWLAAVLSPRWKAGKNIQFHYDRSNAFYEQFLDSRMLYSAAHFDSPDTPLDEAQVRKLDLICAGLQLKPGERFLDIGCGWGGLAIWAAEHYGVFSHGCTLSDQQFQLATAAVQRHKLENRVCVEYRDFREMEGTFDKISSIGMFEHLGTNQLAGYLRKIYLLLRDNGLFLNRGIVRPEGVKDDGETFFLQRNVFPGSHLVHLADVVREGERAGFEVISVEAYREQYARTCRAWVQRLQANKRECQQLVSATTYRTWVLYLAASAVNFEDGVTRTAQVIFVKNRTCAAAA